MGYELRRWLADRLPDGLSSGERLVALEIADQAHERTRLAFGRELLEIVVRRSGLSDAKQVGKILAKLGASGIELRVPIAGKDGQPVRDKLGRVLYACKGHELTLRIPRQADCPALKVPPAGELQSSPARGPNERKAPPAGAQRSPARGTKLPQAGDPTSHYLSDLSSLVPSASPEPSASPASPGDEREILADDAQKIAAAWTAARGRRNSQAEAKVAVSATALLADGWSIPDLISLAEHMARASPNYTDLAKHEGHWQASRTTAAAYKPPTF